MIECKNCPMKHLDDAVEAWYCNMLQRHLENAENFDLQGRPGDCVITPNMPFGKVYELANE